MCDGEICEPMTQQQKQQQQEQPEETREDQKVQTKTLRLNRSPSFTQNDAGADIFNWQLEDVSNWASNTEHFSRSLLDCLRLEAIDGTVLLSLNENDVRDMRFKLGYKLTFGELKKFWLAVMKLQQQQMQKSPPNATAGSPMIMGITGHLTHTTYGGAIGGGATGATTTTAGNIFMPFTTISNATGIPATSACPCPQECPSYVSDCETYQRMGQRMGKRLVAPEYFKTAISLGYSFVVTWITSFVMVIVHERVPDMKRYPPLPDIFLDNVPHIPWAFNMCEITGSLLFTVWLIVLTFHKYRMVLLRRFFALAGTVFLLRCVTMLITSLSVPGTHLQCNQKDFAIDDPNVDMIGALLLRMTRAYRIWSGLGMSIQGVRTCGDYMFSGHTVALTLLNFFITEYTPRNLYFLHTLTWLLNMFGIFFILAAHEHYSIDVFVAFYITSRLFLYYHTLANNRALMQSDSKRTRIWFPMFSYFESSMDGIIPNEFDTPGTLIDGLLYQIIKLKDHLFNAAHRYWLDRSNGLQVKSSSIQFFGNDSTTDHCVHAAATSNYFSPHQSAISGLNNHNATAVDATATTTTTTTTAAATAMPTSTAGATAAMQTRSASTSPSKPHRRAVKDAAIDPYISQKDVISVKDKKVL
ncbi:uncharacterized protein Dwil_GK16808 [Drosophila willistoni]|uniref:SAM domain-containing protein n=1 Tax=Drosophila willistoni TaxID=7260 RepID=B4ML71_DROWI|nr:ceramide phosphoethanolamine synthase [Drosophila willistoni]EDW73129.1 uncharacterized protein Dwil_GK16808 [Drosophila willistoni]